jgi:hypothetical protein
MGISAFKSQIQEFWLQNGQQTFQHANHSVHIKSFNREPLYRSAVTFEFNMQLQPSTSRKNEHLDTH